MLYLVLADFKLSCGCLDVDLRILLREMLLRERMVGLGSTVPQGAANNCAVSGQVHGKGRHQVESVKNGAPPFFLQIKSLFPDVLFRNSTLPHGTGMQYLIK